jgi:hypothetical protein
LLSACRAAAGSDFEVVVVVVVVMPESGSVADGKREVAREVEKDGDGEFMIRL